MAQIEVFARGEVCGFFTLRTNRRGVIAEFKNLITNGGLDRMGNNNDWLQWCQVGSGSSAPNINDTALANRIAGSQTTDSNTNGAQGAAPYYAWRRKVFRFAAGTATGILAEVGVGWASTGGLFSRALILDSDGTPTTIQIQADETLDVTYEFRYYPKTTDDSGQVSLSGNIGGVYDWIWRSANVTDSSVTIGWHIEGNGTSAARAPTGTSSRAWLDGDIGTITSSPSGALSGGATNLTTSVSGYSNGSHKRIFTLSAPLGGGNFATGIRSARIVLGIGSYQIQFDPPIPKTSDDLLSIVVEHAWARRT